MHSKKILYEMDRQLEWLNAVYTLPLPNTRYLSWIEWQIL